MVEPSKEGCHHEIVSAREVLHSIAAGQNPDQRVTDHLAPHRTISAPAWSLSQAADVMTKGGFRHIVVVDMGGVVGISSRCDTSCAAEGSATVPGSAYRHLL